MQEEAGKNIKKNDKQENLEKSSLEGRKKKNLSTDKAVAGRMIFHEGVRR